MVTENIDVEKEREIALEARLIREKKEREEIEELRERYRCFQEEPIKETCRQVGRGIFGITKALYKVPEWAFMLTHAIPTGMRRSYEYTEKFDTEVYEEEQARRTIEIFCPEEKERASRSISYRYYLKQHYSHTEFYPSPDKAKGIFLSALACAGLGLMADIIGYHEASGYFLRNPDPGPEVISIPIITNLASLIYEVFRSYRKNRKKTKK